MISHTQQQILTHHLLNFIYNFLYPYLWWMLSRKIRSTCYWGATQMGEVEAIDAVYCIIPFIAFFLKTNLFYTINLMFSLSLFLTFNLCTFNNIIAFSINTSKTRTSLGIFLLKPFFRLLLMHSSLPYDAEISFVW